MANKKEFDVKGAAFDAPSKLHELSIGELEKLYSSVSLPTDKEIRQQVGSAASLKPDDLVIDDLKWKLGIRGVLRGENVLITGHSGFGKSLTGRSLAKALDRPFFKFNMGATQDARTSLIGNTHFAPDRGTFFVGSRFVQAITTPFAVILLEEVTRMSHDAENIMLMPLDPDQRFLELAESPDVPIINIAPGVCFVATANIGSEYTATRILDRATNDRWSTIVEMDILTEAQEISLAKKKYPELNRNYITGICQTAEFTRKDMRSDNRQLSTIISTRSIHKQCELGLDGLRFSEIVEAVVVNLFDDEGGIGDSERTKVRQAANKNSHLDNESPIAAENAKMKKENPKDNKTMPRKNMFDVDRDSLQ